MEEMTTTTTTMISSQENPRNEAIVHKAITTNIFSGWKLYNNPFYVSDDYPQDHLPLSDHETTASLWDLSLSMPVMEYELEVARTRIMGLKAELECERKARKKLEAANNMLAKELGGERSERDALERVYAELAKGILSEKAEIDRMKKELEEERHMMKTAEFLREERIQMKLADAKIFFEEKLLELEKTKHIPVHQSDSTQYEIKSSSERATGRLSDGKSLDSRQATRSDKASPDPKSSTRLVLSEKNLSNNSVDSKAISRCEKQVRNCDNKNGAIPSTAIQRKASPEPENPHIKRGIKGFVEFPKVVRAMGSKSKQWSTKLECQKAQLRILLKQKSPGRSSNLVRS